MEVKKDIENQKKAAEQKEAHADFFSKRDKTNRGNNGLVHDASTVLNAEAEVKELLYQESLKEHPLPEGTEPMFNTLFLTARRNKLTNDAGVYLPTASFGAAGSTDLEQDFSSYQKVMAKGPQCQQVDVGMEIKINVDNFKRRIQEKLRDEIKENIQYEMPVVEVNGIEYIRISERDVDYIVNNKTDG